MGKHHHERHVEKQHLGHHHEQHHKHHHERHVEKQHHWHHMQQHNRRHEPDVRGARSHVARQIVWGDVRYTDKCDIVLEDTIVMGNVLVEGGSHLKLKRGVIVGSVTVAPSSVFENSGIV